MRARTVLLAALVAASSAHCAFATAIFQRNAAALVREPRRIPARITSARLPDARIAVLWVGHATVLLQLDDKFVLTDPVFTEFAGPLSRRLVEPGIAVEHLPDVSLVAISHVHLDHLSLGSLELIEPVTRALVVPDGGLVYVPNFRFETHGVRLGQSFERDGLRATAVRVDHPSYRYGVDSAWAREAACGWVFEYHGLTVFFGGDTAYDRAAFASIQRRFPSIDLALLPIGPVEPRSVTGHTHIDGREAIEAMLDLRARAMVPIHYDTFAHGMDPPGYAVRVLREAIRARNVSEDRVRVLPIGGRTVITRR